MNARFRFSCLFTSHTLFSLTFAFSQSHLPRAVQTDQKTGVSQASSVTSIGSININNLWLRVRNDGRFGYDTVSGRGLTYPFSSGNLLYMDNALWVGKVSDGNLPLIRTGGGLYRSGVRPGAIVSKGVPEDPALESLRVYRYRPDYESGNLTSDAAAMNGVEISKVTPDMVITLRESYRKDAAEWPWRMGAPFVDKNQNGAMDAGEKPGLQNASQILWLTYNDLDEDVCKFAFGDRPIGLEVQATLWAYKGVPNLEDVIFKRYRFIYKGTSLASSAARIDSMFLTQWFDPDIGYGSDDLGGSDSLLSLGYGYNGKHSGNDQDPVYQPLSIPTPGLGYALLQGPLVPGAGGESGIFNFDTRTGFKNLPMTSCVIHMTGLGDGINERFYGVRTYYYWHVARGFLPFSLSPTSYDSLWSFSPILDNAKRSTKFMYYGDPEAGTGWLASAPRAGISTFEHGGETRLYMSTGPFTMALGDTQEVVIAMIASAAPTAVQNVTWLKNRAKYVRAIYPNLGEYAVGFVTGVSDNSIVPGEFTLDQNYPNPFNPSTQIRFTIPRDGQAKLSVFDLLGQETKVLFHGSLAAGQHTVAWDGSDASGEAAPSGVYFYRLTHGDRQVTRKLLLLR